MSISIIDNNLVKSRDASRVIRNCLFFCAYSPLVKGELKRQTRALLFDLNDELLPSDRIRLCLADDNLSDQKDFKQRQKGRLDYDE